MKETNKDMATVSVAIIAKNEAATITPAIESVRDIVDEVVVLVDTSTTDNTFDLALKAGADIVEMYIWEDDFASARNKAISKCSSDWICIMDGHEILHPKSKDVLRDLMIRVIKKRDLHDTEMFSAYIYMNPKGNNIDTLIPETLLMQPRLFKNNGEHTYVSRVHNYLVSKEGNRGLKRPVPELVFIHKRTTENDAVRRKQRREMNVPLLLKEIEENPELPRSYFYLANTYYEMAEYDNAIKYYDLYLERSGWRQERAQARMMISSIYAERKDFDRARTYIMQALDDDWERPEFYLLLGDIALEQKDFYQAEHWYKSSCDMKPPVTSGMFLRGPAYTYLPYAKLAMLYSTPGVEEYFKALTAGEKAITLGYDGKDLLDKINVWKSNLTLTPTQKNLIIYDENNTFTFVRDLSNKLMSNYNIARASDYDVERAKWGDIIWFEWCAKNILKASSLPKKEGQKWIVRLHGFEVFNSSRIPKIKFEKIDVLIFVCKHVKQHFNDLYQIPNSVKQLVIPNGIDTSLWSYADRSIRDIKTISVVGILTEKKGPQLLGQVIKHFAKRLPEYKFKLRMDIVDKPCMASRTLHQLIDGLNNWEWVPRQESLNRFLEDTKYLLSTSTLESFSYVIGEAMAKGIKPLIHNWIGAKDIWPNSLIWSDINELVALLDTPYESVKYRDYVKENYGIDKLTKSIVGEIEELIQDGK